MKKIIQVLIFTVMYLTITSCANQVTEQINTDGSTQWDFDHHLKFKQTELAPNIFVLEVIPNNKVGFGHLAKFLLRQSYDLCGHYYYRLEMMQGIEGVDDKRAMPNYILPSLMAKVECNTQHK